MVYLVQNNLFLLKLMISDVSSTLPYILPAKFQTDHIEVMFGQF